MLLKSCLAFVCGLSFALSANAQIRGAQGHLVPGRGAVLMPPPLPIRNQDDRAERLRRMSQRLAQQIDQKAGMMSDRDLTETMELLKRAGEIVKSSGDNNLPQLVDAETLSVSRKGGGEWITVRYDQPQDISQLNLRAIGSGSVRIYAINILNTAGQSIRLTNSTMDIAGNSVQTVYSSAAGLATHVQVLAEAFRSTMSLTVESYGSSIGQVDPGQPPVVVNPPPPLTGPKCDLYGNGGYNGYAYRYRGGYNNDAKFGTDDFDKMISSMNDLESAGLCHKSFDVGCTMVGSGGFNGYVYKFRIAANNTIVTGTDDRNTIMNQLSNLVNNRICRPVAQACDLLSSGGFNGYVYAHRISVGNAVVFGTDNQQEAFNFLRDVRQAGLCQ
jgi:hypothetical protein